MSTLNLNRRLQLIITAAVTVAGCAGVRDDGVNLSYKMPPLVPTTAAVSSPAEPVLRSQSADTWVSEWDNESTPGSDNAFRRPMAVSGIPSDTNATSKSTVQQAQFTRGTAGNTAGDVWNLSSGDRPASSNAISGPTTSSANTTPRAPLSGATSPLWQSTVPHVAQAPAAPNRVAQNPVGGATLDGPVQLSPAAPNGMPATPPGLIPPPSSLGNGPSPMMGLPTPYADIFVNVQETQTGSLMIGAAVNSDAGVTGQIVVDEKNFDWRRVPRSWDDVASGTAFRGAGQGFRLEAMPGTQVQRYMVNFTEPYLGGTRVSFNMSGYLYDRQFFDWDEQRLGGRVGLGYRITPDLSVAANLKAEEVKITDPRVVGVPELDSALGNHELYSTRFSLTQDTRDIPFAPTQGYFFEVHYEQAFGSFDYPRGGIDYRRYFLITERPDGSGRHVLGVSNRAMLTGSDTPIFENYFAGGYSTLRGFEFRGASPQSGGVVVGGEFMMLGSVEYLFPITADDMLKGVAFVDYGTVEEELQIEAGDYRVSLGAGLRISIPMMGPAPIALDFAVPVARESTDDIRIFSFFMGVSR